MTTFRKGGIFIFTSFLTVYVKWVYYGLKYRKILELVNLFGMNICAKNLMGRGVKELGVRKRKI
jgi:hypothetical protein